MRELNLGFYFYFLVSCRIMVTVEFCCRVESIEVHLPAAGKGVPSWSKPSVSFSVTWKLDTHKCIDASPLMVLKKLQPTPTIEESEGVTKRNFGGYDDIVVYVGSHSHLFMAVELSTGKEVWHVELPDRVESSACISSCGKFVAVGKFLSRIYQVGGTLVLLGFRVYPPGIWLILCRVDK